MFKKRGKIKALVLISLAIVIFIIFMVLFFGYRENNSEKSYKLTIEEEIALNDMVDKIKLDAAPECKAFLKKDIKYCMDSENEEDKNDCLNYISLIMLSTEKNESYCSNLTNDIEEKYCKEYIEGKMNCELLEKDQKGYCMALTKKDIEYCEDIEGSSLKNDCIGEIGLIIAILNNDEKGCMDIPQEWIREYCIAWISEEKEICTKRVDSVDVDELKTQLAVKTGNNMLCYTINKTKEKEFCILEFAVKDSSICNEILTSDIKKACTAITNKQKNICEEVQDERARIICKGNAQN